MKTIPVLVLSFAAAAACGAVKQGDAFPSLANAELTGGTAPESKGQVTLVDFCASWCAPCKASFPAYDRLFAAYKPKGLCLVAISVDQREADFTRFVRQLHPTFPVLDDASQKLVAEVGVPTMPTSYLIDRTGHVRFVHTGFHSGSTERELRTEIDALLAEKPAGS